MLVSLAGAGPSTAALWLSWRADPLALCGLGILAAGYGGGVARLSRRGLGWPVARTLSWLSGLALLTLVTLGGPDIWSRSLLWMFTVRLLTLFLVAPPLLAFGRPLVLVGDALQSSRIVDRGVRAIRRMAAWVGHPVVAPVVVPTVLAVVYFSPLLTVALTDRAAGAGLDLFVFALGLLVALGFVGEKFEGQTALALMAALGLGLAELMFDAIPGIVVTFHSHLLVGLSWPGLHRGWPPSPHVDQTHAGAILWGVAEFSDVPFLAVLVRRLMRADAMEGARADRDTTFNTGAALNDGVTAVVHSDDLDAPWWISNPELMRGHLLGRLRETEDPEDRRG